jgi:serine/threonine protein kinase
MINSTNLLYFIPKITDFRYSLVMGTQEVTFGRYGHKNFMSPEIYKDVGYNKSIDIWNYGSLIYFIYTGVPPFSQIKDNFVRVNTILNMDIPMDDKLKDAKALISSCMKRESSGRSNIVDILQNKLFDRFKKNN